MLSRIVWISAGVVATAVAGYLGKRLLFADSIAAWTCPLGREANALRRRPQRQHSTLPETNGDGVVNPMH